MNAGREEKAEAQTSMYICSTFNHII